MTNTQTHVCLNCAASEMETPLVSLRYQGQHTWICTQCLPQLIHHPQTLAGKLSAMNAASNKT